MERTFSLDGHCWKTLTSSIRWACRKVNQSGPRPRRCTYSDLLIVSMYFWCVWHSRSFSWACQRDHYNRLFRPRKLPSISQFTRRIGEDRTQLILQYVHNRLACVQRPCDGVIMDGQPLLVSPVSKDPDAHRGHISGGFAKGYKLHAFVTRDRRIVCWSVMPLNTGESPVAQAMLPYLPPMRPDALSLADGNYDAAMLYKGHAALDSALLTPLRGQHQRKNGEHHPVTLRQMGQARRQVVEAWQEHRDLLEALLKERNTVEQVFSVLMTAMDLRLPACVRRLGRVKRYVGVKICLYHARLLALEEQKRQRVG